MKKRPSAGSRWLFGGRLVEIDGPLAGTEVQVRDVQTGSLLPVSLEALLPPSAMPDRTDPLLIRQDEWDRALALARAFEPYLIGTLPSLVAKEFGARFGVGARQILRDLAEYRAVQRTSALVRQSGGRPKGTRVLAPATERIIQHVIDKHYSRRESATKAEIHERVCLLCIRLGLSAPDYKTVDARIEAQNKAELAYKQLGAKAGRQMFQPRPGAFEVTRALGVVQIDHTLADVMLVAEDDASRVIGRPWLTLAIDVATRAVVGYYLSMHPPSAVSVAMCVAHAVLPKEENDLEPGLWPMYGKFEGLLVDNGKDLRSDAFQRGCEQYGIDLKWRPVRRPHYGAHIERLMGTFMRRVHTLPGTTFSNARRRGDYPSEKKACFTLADFRAWLVEQICHGYHVRHHRGIGMPPLVAWERALEDKDGNLLAPIVIDNRDLRRDFYPFVYRRMQRTGVQFENSRYWHPDLAALIAPDRMVQVHYHPGNLSCVWVRGSDNLLIEAPAVAGAALGKARPADLDEANVRRLNDLKRIGYERGDFIRDGAERRKRKQRVVGPPASKQTLEQHTRPSVQSSRPAIPLDRSSVTTEVLDL